MADHVTTSCAVLHTDGEGNIVPCPGYPHAEEVAAEPDEFGLHHCPHCTDAVRDLDAHLKTCRARQEEQLAEARRLLADEAEARASACQAEIQAVLDRHGMRLEISTPAVSIVPNP